MSAEFTIVVKLQDDNSNPLFLGNPEDVISVKLGLYRSGIRRAVIPSRPGGMFSPGKTTYIFSTISDALAQEFINGSEKYSLYIWAEDLGSAAFTSSLIEDPELARGRLEVPFYHGVIRGAVSQNSTTSEIYFEVGVTQSVIQWVASQMSLHSYDQNTLRMRMLNEQADRLEQAAMDVDPYYRRREGVILADGSGITQYLDPDTRPDTSEPMTVLGIPFGRTRSIGENEAAANIFHKALTNLRGEAQGIMRGLGRPPITEGGISVITEMMYSGENSWELKGPIESAWGAYCRLGNVPWHVKHDDLSNLHFGYAGAFAHFSPIELEYNAHAGSFVRTGKLDDPRDQIAVQEGMDLMAEVASGENIFDWEDILEIINSNSTMRH